MAYLPEKAYEEEDPEDPIHLSTDDIDVIIEFCNSKVGSLYPEKEFEDYVAKTVEVNKETTGVKPATVRRQLREGRTALANAADAAAERREELALANK